MMMSVMAGEYGQGLTVGVGARRYPGRMPQHDVSELETLREAIRDELGSLWGDLGQARNSAINGKWSMHCDRLVARIGKLTRLVGPTPWEEIHLPLLENGIYQRIHAELGVDAPVDMERVAKARASIDARMARTLSSR
jgi:hypothetical protein